MVNIGNTTTKSSGSKAIKVIKAKKANLEKVGDWVNLHEYQYLPQVLERFSSCFSKRAVRVKVGGVCPVKRSLRGDGCGWCKEIHLDHFKLGDVKK